MVKMVKRKEGQNARMISRLGGRFGGGRFKGQIINFNIVCQIQAKFNKACILIKKPISLKLLLGISG